jgi:hypothetical protein
MVLNFDLPLFNLAAGFNSLLYNAAGRVYLKIKELTRRYIK